ncbi:MAG TPA: hypothetical protein DCF33_21490 [Saprospirales bacterium]|nr:hypothetical protein [Saprospirales bacterium]
MANPYDNDKRLLELLERWQSGDFTSADEQEMQLLTGSDDFRRESVEGFMAMPEVDHAKHLASLQRRLKERTGTAKRVLMPQLLMAVAAVILLVVAVVWLIPSTENAAKQEALATESAPPVPSSSADSSDGLSAAEPDLTDAPSSADNSGGLSAAEPDLAVAPARGREAIVARDVEGAFLSQTAEPGRRYPTMADLDSLVALPVTAAPEPAVGMADKESREAEMAKVEEALDDVDLRYGNMIPPKKDVEAKKAKSQPKAESAKPKPSGTAEAQPSGGWDAFNEYLRQNARLPEQARQNNVSGIVRIRFLVDKNGQPKDFFILKPLGFGCDEAARRLIEQYRWSPGQNDTLAVDIPFVR